MFRIVAVGSLKEAYLKAAEKDYSDRISRYDKISFTEIPNANPSLPDEKIKAFEAQGILKAVKTADFVILCDLGGKSLSSEEFAEMINTCRINGKSEIAFVVGGSTGVDETVKQRADLCVSFSRLTFPHALFRVMLSEQIYRAMKIINNETYHK